MNANIGTSLGSPARRPEPNVDTHMRRDAANAAPGDDCQDRRAGQDHEPARALPDHTLARSTVALCRLWHVACCIAACGFALHASAAELASTGCTNAPTVRSPCA